MSKIKQRCKFLTRHIPRDTVIIILDILQVFTSAKFDASSEQFYLTSSLSPQIQYMQNGVLPSDLSSCLVFHSAGVNQLANRIKELQQEKAHQIRKFKLVAHLRKK